MVIAYVDRANLSVVLATRSISRRFSRGRFQPRIAELRVLLELCALQIPAGWVVDRFGVKRPYAVAFLAWTFISAATGMVNSVSQLLVLRLLLGAGESICAPASLRWIRWNCPEEQRGLAVGIYMAGTKIGAAIGVPIAAFLITAFSWRTMFVICGLAGLVWLVGWLFLANDEPASETPAFNENSRRHAGFCGLARQPRDLGNPAGHFFVWLLSLLLRHLAAGISCRIPALSLSSMGYYALFSFGGMAVSQSCPGGLLTR